MANNYFQFKQFRVDQEGSAMKVTTEGCILGALAAQHNASRILDIGSGTGLLALMLAQAVPGQIVTVEADYYAFLQTSKNVESSPWKERISAQHATIQEFALGQEPTFDLIVSNPPFFTNYLKADSFRKNQAKHTVGLSMDDLVSVATKLLSDEGAFYVLYPAYEAGLFASIAGKSGLYPQLNVIVRNKADGPIFRMVTVYTRQKVTCQQREITIRSSEKEYSAEFKELLREYYLAF